MLLYIYLYLQLLLFIGNTSPECIPASRQGFTLTIPPPPPPMLPAEQEEEVLNALLHQKHIELEYYYKHAYDSWYLSDHFVVYLNDYLIYLMLI